MTTRLRERLHRKPPGYEYTIGRIFAIYAGLMVTLLLAALDQTIVATALPRIVSDLGGLSQYSWVFTAYMLATTVTVPLYGKLGDVHAYWRPPQTSPSRSDVVPAASTPAPSQSIECSCRSARTRRGIVSAITSSARPPTGRFT